MGLCVNYGNLRCAVQNWLEYTSGNFHRTSGSRVGGYSSKQILPRSDECQYPLPLKGCGEAVPDVCRVNTCGNRQRVIISKRRLIRSSRSDMVVTSRMSSNSMQSGWIEHKMGSCGTFGPIAGIACSHTELMKLLGRGL